MNEELVLILALRALPLLIDLIKGRRDSLTRDEILDELSKDRDDALDDLKTRVTKGYDDNGTSD